MIYSFLKKYYLFFSILFLAISGISQIFTYLIVTISVIFILKKPKLIIDYNLIFLTAFTLLYNIFTQFGGPVGRTVVILFPISFYIFGKYLSSIVQFKKDINLLLISFVIIFNIVPLLSYLVNVFNYGLNFSNLRLIGSDLDYIAYTNFASYFAINMAFFPFIFYHSSNSFETRVKRITIWLSLMGIFIIGTIGQRTGIFIILISITIYLLYTRLLVLRGLTYKFVILSIVLFFAYNFIQWEWLINSTIYQRLFVSDTDKGIISTRSDLWEAAYNVFLKNPFGGEEQLAYEGYIYAHNLWLDVGLRAGYIPLIPLLIITILFVINLLKFNKTKFEPLTKLLFILISTAFFSTFMVEPIMEGYTHFFCAFLYVFGVLSGVCASSKLSKIKNE